ncbi:hypothetical protein BEH94_07790 [Candidatus Altiarchaeales archaeon WOR_SM1_SCG]|nr:hypothetical protein BEH94_07790 [Candidatus Altiarchaeales archaeon WOR_SM1_SCG]
MDLIYLWPGLSNEAPQKVGKNIIKYIANRKGDVKFNLKILHNEKKLNRDLPKNLDVITYNEFKNLKTRSIIHEPITPSIPLLSGWDKLRIYWLSSQKKIPIISNYHGDFYTEFVWWIKNREFFKIAINIRRFPFEPFLFRMNHIVIVHSPIMKDLLERRHRLAKIMIIPNGIGEWWFNTKVPQIELDGKPSIFYHGRLSYEKGLMHLIEAFSKIKKKTKSRAKLYLAGSGSLEKKLRDMCKKLGIESDVIFIGKLNQEKIKMYLQSCDAAIYPSLFESFPLSYLEALSSAKGPCYFSNKGSQGILYFASDEEKKILNLFEPTKAGIYEVFSRIIRCSERNNLKQKKFAKKFLWEKVINYYIKLYNEIYDELNY